MINIIRRILILLLASGLVACSSLPDKNKIPVAGLEHTLYFIYREWHTSLMLDAKTVARYSRHMQAEAEGRQFVRIGWGDGDYFTGRSKSVGTAAKALVASRYSALQLLSYSSSPFAQIPADTYVPIAISDEAMRNLIRYLDNSFAVDTHGQLIPLPAYLEGTGQFYQSQHDYGLFANCNTWSGRALQAAGLPVRSAFKLTAQSVFEQAQQISLHQQAIGLIGKDSLPQPE
uniref:DUF2459 domain-containing protein n=1 Tax=Cellvibrio fontiphilus TaxID=1815559 RepID=UPI002B4BDD5F|nr:DUF2459 domain-containing protein [Cellvibrio fontiphilus]